LTKSEYCRTIVPVPALEETVNAVTFDQHETAARLKDKYPVRLVALRFPEARRAGAKFEDLTES